MASGAARIVTGKYTGTGALITLNTVGFRPQRVELMVSAGTKVGAKASYQDTLADGSMVKTTAAGVGSLSVVGVTPLAGGFSMGTDVDLNNAGDTVHYTAYE